MKQEIFEKTYVIFVGTEEQMELYSKEHPDATIIGSIGTGNDPCLLTQIDYFINNLPDMLVSSGATLWNTKNYYDSRDTMLEVVPGNSFWQGLTLLIGQWIASRCSVDCYLTIFDASGKIKELYS